MDSELKIISTKSGVPSLQWQGRYLHSRHDPVKESRSQLSQLALNNIEAHTIIFFIGAGLGYIISEFYRRYTNVAIWYEPNPDIASLAIKHNDLGKYLESKQLRLLQKKSIGDNELQNIIENHNNSDVLFCGHRASYPIAPEYLQFQKSLEGLLNRKSVNMATLARFDRLWMRNILANYHALLRARPVKELFALVSNQPVLVCGAGPSLHYDLDIIHKYRNCFLLICVDTALAPLVKKGIDPDIVLCVDPQPISRHYITGYEGEAFFVVDPSCSYLALRLIPPERLFYFWSPFSLSKLFFDFIGEEPGKIAFGGSVSTNAYDLAIQMGCDPIILAGQDAAFTDGLAHLRGAVLEEHIFHKQDRFFNYELHNYRQLNALPIRYLTADTKEKVDKIATNDKLLIFHQWFQRRIQEDLQRGFQIKKISNKGAKLEGLLSEDGETFFSKQINSLDNMVSIKKLIKTKDSLLVQKNQKRAKEFYKLIEKLSHEFTNYICKVKDGIRIAQKLHDTLLQKTHTSNYFDLLNEMETIDKEIIQFKKISALASHVLQRLIFQILEENKSKSKGNNEQQKNDDHSSRLEISQKSLQLYNGLLEASLSHQKWLKRTAKIFI